MSRDGARSRARGRPGTPESGRRRMLRPRRARRAAEPRLSAGRGPGSGRDSGPGRAAEVLGSRGRRTPGTPTWTRRSGLSGPARSS